MSETPAPDRPLTLDEFARVAGTYCWVESRLFEVFGGWAAGVPDPEVQRCLSTHSYHHGWHAQLWRERLPVLPGAAPDDVVRSTGPALEDLFGALEAIEPENTIDKLVAGYRVVYPRLLRAYTRHRARTTPVADGPAIRALDLIVADLLVDWQEGEALIQSRIVTTADVAPAARIQGRFEEMVVRAGGVGAPG